jgi:hypothetical protein
MSNKASMEMPKYKCHKEVWALKIKAIDGMVLTPEDKGFSPFTVDSDYLSKHNPEPGGYYVVYKGAIPRSRLLKHLKKDIQKDKMALVSHH